MDTTLITNPTRIVTLDPFIGPRSEQDLSEERRKRTGRRIKEQKIKQLLPLQDLFVDEQKFPPYYVLNFPGIDIDSQLNVIAADSEIKLKIGKPKKICKLNKNALLIQVLSEEQGKKLSKLTSVANQLVTSQLHRTLNTTKGTVVSEVMAKSSEEEILARLKDQGVTKIERMKRRVDGHLIDTNRYILTFSRTKLPHLIKLADWHQEIVDLYIPTPLRCNKCQKFGHTKNWCKREEEVCSRCGQSGHRIVQCVNAALCVNCKGDHPATSRNCDMFILRSEVMATMTREHITHLEATDKVKTRYREQGKTYSFVSRPPPATMPPTNQQPNSNITSTPDNQETPHRTLQSTTGTTSKTTHEHAIPTSNEDTLPLSKKKKLPTTSINIPEPILTLENTKRKHQSKPKNEPPTSKPSLPNKTRTVSLDRTHVRQRNIVDYDSDDSHNMEVTDNGAIYKRKRNTINQDEKQKHKISKDGEFSLAIPKVPPKYDTIPVIGACKTYSFQHRDPRGEGNYRPPPPSNKPNK